MAGSDPATPGHRVSKVKVVPFRSVKAITGRTGTGLQQVRRRAVTWPAAVSAAVKVPADGGLVRVGMSPIWLAQRKSASTSAKATQTVDVQTLDHAQVSRIGGVGVGLTAVQAGGGSAARLNVRINAAGFAGATGGDLLSRLHVVGLPACALKTPALPVCQRRTALPSSVDVAAQTVTANLPANDISQQVFLLAAGTSGETGSFQASPLSSAARWQVGGGTGGFSWSYPIPAVPVPGGSGPDLSVGYTSQAVDGMVASENNQPSWAGLGWDVAVPFIERRYETCQEEVFGTPPQPVTGYGASNDDCWAGDVLELSLNGHSSPLVRDTAAGGDVWRPRDDPGWRAERFTGVSNGDNNGEYWKVQTPDGITYTFGLGAQPGTGRATNSAFTVPVFGNNTPDPCHAATVAASWCQQAWRWNVDSMVDPHGNEATYFYQQERNNYARLGTTTTPYVRGGYVTDIEYGARSGSESVTAPARLHFTTSLRCTGIAGGGATSCPALTSSSPDSDYPDVPASQICTSACTAAQSAPTFFTGVLLSSITAQRSAGATWTDVDRVDFRYSYPKPSDGTSASLWLESIQRTGLVGGSLALPKVTFAGTELANRVESAATPLKKLRVSSIVDELGRRIDVTYGLPDRCSDANIPVGHEDTNVLDCYPAWRTAGPGDEGFGHWNKYLVTQLKVIDQTGGSPAQTTQYRYVGQPAWHYDDTPATPVKKQSWGDWRGYPQVDTVAMSDPAFRGSATSQPLSLTRDRFFRGMDGDRLAGDPMTAMGSRRFSVTDSSGTTLTDDPWLSGRVREEQRFALNSSGDPVYELDGTLTTFGVARTTPFTAGSTDPKRDAHLVVPVKETGRETVIADPAGTRTTRSTTTDTTYDVYGQPLTETQTAPGAGAAGGGSDVRCTRSSYARDPATVSAYLVSFPYRVRSYAGTCAAPSTLIHSVDTYYDGSSTLGATLTRGDGTKLVTATTASGPDAVSQSITSSTAFDAYGRVVSKTDGNGHTSTVAYAPASGIPATNTATNALGQRAVTTLEPARGQPISVKDSNAQTTSESYDPLGRLISVRLPGQAGGDPPAYAFAYSLDPDHTAPPRTTSRQLQSGSTYVTGWSYLDSSGRVRQQQAVSPASTGAAPRMIVNDTRYDDRGLVAATTLPVVVSSAAGGGLTALASNAADETRTTYDELQRPVRQAFYASGTAKWATTSDYFGDHVRATPPAGGVVAASWTDVLGRQIRSDQGTGASLVSTAFRYDDADRLVASTDPAGHRSTFGYDLADRRTTASDPDAGTTSTVYDDAGNVRSTTDANGTTVTADYDVTDRPTTVWQGASGSGTRLATYSWDSTSIPNGVGRLASQTAYATGDSNKPYTQAVTGYDAQGQVTGRSWAFPAGTGLTLIPSTYKVSYTYDAAGHQTSITYPDRVVGLDPETVTTEYDALGNTTRLTGTRTPLIGAPTTDTYVSATGYGADGKLTSRDYANPFHPLQRQYGYEADTQRLSSIATTVGDPGGGTPATKQADSYSWDPSGNLTKIVDNAPQGLGASPTATCYAYDQLNRVSHAWSTAKTDCSDADSTLVHDGPSGFNESWTYSPDGDITSARSLLVNRTFDYGDANHPHAVTRAGLDIFGYDAAGQQNTRVKTALPGVMTWTPQHQLQTLASGVKISRFVYGADGTRLVRFNPDSTATLYIDGEEILVVAGIAKGTRFYSQGGTTVAERLPTGLLTWQFGDTQGSAQISVLAGTSLLSRSYYDPYGKARDFSTSPATDRGFLGKPEDSWTGLDALGARYYDPDLGRFTSPDPLNQQSTAQTANPYAYSANNPVMFMDPSGLESSPGCNVECSEGLDQYAPEVSSHPQTVYQSAPSSAPAAVAQKQGFWGKVGGGLKSFGGGVKNLSGGIGSGLWTVGPGMVGDTVGLLPFDWADQFQQGVDGGKEMLTRWYGADTNSFLYKAGNVGTIAASLLDGAGEIRGLLKGSEKAKGLWNWGRQLLKGGEKVKTPQVLKVGDVKLPAVPKGAVGTPVSTGKGLEYSIPKGTPELDPRVTRVRIMDPITKGKYQYPNGYAVYMNDAGQTVSPLTGKTVVPSDPLSHISLP